MINGNLSGVSETLLIPLYMRAKDARSQKSMLHDKAAIRMMEKIDYPFSRFDKIWISYYGTVSRAYMMDEETRGFLQSYPQATIVSMGCGLDTRLQRVDNGQVRWYNIDVPEVMELRSVLLPAQEREMNIAISLLEEAWTSKIEVTGELLFISEGVWMYFTKEEVCRLMRIMTQAFTSFTAMIDMVSPFVAKRSRSHDAIHDMGVSFQWGTKDGKELVEWEPRWTQLECINFTDAMRNMLPGWKKLLIPFFYYTHNRMGIYRYENESV